MIAGSPAVAAMATTVAIAGRIAAKPVPKATGVEDRDNKLAAVRSRAARPLSGRERSPKPGRTLPPKPCFIA